MPKVLTEANRYEILELLAQQVYRPPREYVSSNFDAFSGTMPAEGLGYLSGGLVGLESPPDLCNNRHALGRPSGYYRLSQVASNPNTVWTCSWGLGQRDMARKTMHV